MRIELLDGYYVDIDSLNFTLKQKYQGEKKDGSHFYAEKTIGYFGSLKAAVEQYLKECNRKDDVVISMREYVERIERSNHDAVERITEWGKRNEV